MTKKLRIATRKSRLALKQTYLVQQALLAEHPDLEIEFVEITTQGDKNLTTSLAKIGGKGLFVKELENALLNNQADIAVHSMKDIPPEEMGELTIASICKREQPWDAFVSNQYTHYQQLPPNARVGTSSLRRQAQLLALRPDISIQILRGNVDTRVDKLDRKEFDAIILAAAGLIRLGKSERIQQIFSSDEMLPAAGQGAIAIQCRKNDREILDLLTPLHDTMTAYCVAAERAATKRLGANCQTPIAVFAEIISDQLIVKGKILSADGKECISADVKGPLQQATELGDKLGQALLENGAQRLLELVTQ